MNTKLLNKVIAHIEEEPSRLDMLGWAYLTHRSPCGTAACIAGWTVLITSKLPHRDVIESEESFWQKAQKKLGLTEDESGSLFILESWPSKFSRAYKDAASDKQAARVTVRRIRHFIETKGRE